MGYDHEHGACERYADGIAAECEELRDKLRAKELTGLDRLAVASARVALDESRDEATVAAHVPLLLAIIDRFAPPPDREGRPR